VNHMASEKSPDYRASCMEDNDEIEGLNEKLIQLLSVQKHFSPVLPNSSLCEQEDDCGSTLDAKASSSLSFSHCRHDCSLLYYDSPAKMPSTSNHLPPIGVFWDIENCQVGSIYLLFERRDSCRIFWLYNKFYKYIV
jgi:hypothetical protein